MNRKIFNLSLFATFILCMQGAISIVDDSDEDARHHRPTLLVVVFITWLTTRMIAISFHHHWKSHFRIDRQPR